MAAAPDHCVPEVIPLTRVRTAELEPVLGEERLAWRSILNWDFAFSADLVRRFVSIQALNGFALLAGSTVIGYSYYVSEDRKGLIGDLFVTRDWATPEYEDLLLSSVLHALAATSGVQRIEAQLMMLHGPFGRALPLGRFGQIYPRIFMVAELRHVHELPLMTTSPPMTFLNWESGNGDDAARVIAAAYRNHVDSNINDQYRSWNGARKFLHNIVQYPGCGTFFQPASFVACDQAGRVCGLILSSRVASDVGHITQICVGPEVRGRGVGYELLRRSLVALAENGCEKVSLTVTAANRGAVTLYQNVGFRAVRRFAAYVWEGF